MWTEDQNQEGSPQNQCSCPLCALPFGLLFMSSSQSAQACQLCLFSISAQSPPAPALSPLTLVSCFNENLQLVFLFPALPLPGVLHFTHRIRFLIYESAHVSSWLSNASVTIHCQKVQPNLLCLAHPCFCPLIPPCLSTLTSDHFLPHTPLLAMLSHVGVLSHRLFPAS